MDVTYGVARSNGCGLKHFYGVAGISSCYFKFLYTTIIIKDLSTLK